MLNLWKDWRIRYGPGSLGYLDIVESGCTVCSRVPDNKKS